MNFEESYKQFEKDGYVVIENFLSDEDVEALKQECWQIVEDMDPKEHNIVFSTQDNRVHSNDYFLNSGDKVRFFFEAKAKDSEGNLNVDKHKSLNKIGHALHELHPNFKRVTFNSDVKALTKAFGYEDPVVMQSMYIFKQPGIGGEVTPHQDATYLHLDGEKKLMGLWIALEDADEENGCLSFIPGSHKGGLIDDYKFVRNDDKESEEILHHVGKRPAYEGKYKATPIKKGSLIAINGYVIHKSAENESERSRHIYTFHLYDGASAKWSECNWLQPTEALPFSHIFPKS